MPVSTKRKAPAKLVAPVVKPNAKLSTKNTIDESRAVVSGTDAVQAPENAISISSDSESDEDVSSAEEEEAAASQTNGDTKGANGKSSVNGKRKGELPSPDVPEEESDDEATSPSFGELLRGNEAIDVPALLQQSSTASAVAAPSRTAIVPPPNQSLTTVVSQALRTDDTDLLESCLHTTDLNTIRNTIENIDSALAGVLLSSLASRLYRRPGRAGTLMTWVQWTLIAHGGALASQPKVVQNLGSLQKVLSERAKGLNSLLILKGKLDLLEGQMDLRRKMRRTSGAFQNADSDEEDEEDQDLIYVEGEEKNAAAAAKALTNGAGSRRRRAVNDDEEEDEDMGAVYNEIADSDDSEDDSEGHYDDSEAAEESLDEDEVDHEDVDDSMGEDEESEVEAAPPTKIQKTARATRKRK